MKILAIDPGSEESAFVQLYKSHVGLHGKLPNEEVEVLICTEWQYIADVFVIEMIASYGMPVGREVFDTCVWIGRFYAATLPKERALLYRRDEKIFLCGSMKAKDANIRQALIDMWGGKEKAIGNKKDPGELYGIHADEWAALAVAVTFRDMER